jgi:hypothetical protein
MARRTFDVVDITEILVHWHAGRSKSEIAQSLGMDRKTASTYIAAAVAAGMRPGGPPVAEDRWAELAREWFPGAGRYPAAAGDLVGDREAPGRAAGARGTACSLVRNYPHRGPKLRPW